MRSGYNYDEETNSYNFGLGGGLSEKITNATQKGDLLMLDFEILGGGYHQRIYSTGTLTIQLLGGNGYKYKSCTSKENPQQIWVVGDSGEMPAQFASMNEVEKFNKVFLMPALVNSGIASESWSSEETMNPEMLYDFYLLKSGQEGKRAIHPEEEVENQIQNYFNVSIEHIRKSKQYDSKTKSYKDKTVLKKLASKVIHAEFDEQYSRLNLDFELYENNSELAICNGTLAIDILGGEEHYRFVSCDISEHKIL